MILVLTDSIRNYLRLGFSLRRVFQHSPWALTFYCSEFPPFSTGGSNLVCVFLPSLGYRFKKLGERCELLLMHLHIAYH